MASSTTNLGLRKPAVSENWSVQDDFNANMDRIDSFVGDCVNANQGGVSSASGLSDLLDSMLSSLRYNGVKAFQMNVTTSFSYFSVATYICTLYKSTSNTTYATATFRRIDQPIVIDGARNTNGWSFNSLNSQMEVSGYNMNQWFSALEDTDNSAYMWAQGHLRVITFQGKRRTHTEDEVLFTLPAEHRPAMTIRCAGSYNGVSVVISINTDGTGVLFVAHGQTAIGRIYFSVAFMH